MASGTRGRLGLRIYAATKVVRTIWRLQEWSERLEAWLIDRVFLWQDEGLRSRPCAPDPASGATSQTLPDERDV